MTKAFRFGTGSRAEIATVHTDLQRLCHLALELSPIDFRVLQGIRTFEEQLAAFKGGFSKIDPRKGKPGRHMVGCAIDFAVFDPKTGKITFDYPDRYAAVRAAFYKASEQTGIPIRTLENIGDLGHIELPKGSVPDNWQTKR